MNLVSNYLEKNMLSNTVNIKTPYPYLMNLVSNYLEKNILSNAVNIKTPYPYLMNLVSNYLEKNILSNAVNINGIQSRMSLKLRIKVVAFFLGHSV